ncbi:MAG: TIGR00269 family protein [Candidatus Altiarchaeota archaeon]
MDEKNFVEHFEEQVKKTIDDFELIAKGDKILVACSGGKDSTTALYLLKKFGYKVEALFIDLLLGRYSEKNFENIKKFCNENKIKLHKVSIRDEFGYKICYIHSILKSKGYSIKNCTICGVMKRSIMNRKARELNATKMATGHNLDDEAQTIFMNFLQGNLSLCAKLGPKTGFIKDEKFVPRIKPLYFCPEEEIRKYSMLKKFPVLYEKCPCAVDTFRLEIKGYLNEIEKKNPGVKEKIVYNFIKILPKIKEYYKSDEKLKYCKICGEPSRKEICKACEIVRIMMGK